MSRLLLRLLHVLFVLLLVIHDMMMTLLLSCWLLISWRYHLCPESLLKVSLERNHPQPPFYLCLVGDVGASDITILVGICALASIPYHTLK